jgi:hypothetical protein
MKTVVSLSLVIAALAFVAAAAGLFWPTAADPFQFQTLRGEIVTISGQGLYYYDTVSSAAQVRGGDVVTLVMAVPLLLAAVVMVRRGSLRGKLLLSGTLAYFLYTYASLSLNLAYNPLFLLYVALFSLSLFAFILSLMAIDVASLSRYLSPTLPRRGIAALLFFVAASLTLMWLGRIVPPLLQGTPPVGLDSTTTLVIQVLDLGVIVPLAAISGALLLRRAAWGYLLASLVLMKSLTMGSAVSAMAFAQVLAGQPINPAELVIFPLITLVNAVMAIILLRGVAEPTGPSLRIRVALDLVPR